MRLMGLDYGNRTVGVALSDPLGMMAMPFETIFRERTTKLKKTMARIAAIIEEYEVQAIIIGYPLLMNGDVGERCEKTDAFIQMLKKRFDLPIHLCDERLSTFEAHQILDDMDIPRRYHKEKIDQIAASFILERYMNEEKNDTNNHL